MQTFLKFGKPNLCYCTKRVMAFYFDLTYAREKEREQINMINSKQILYSKGHGHNLIKVMLALGEQKTDLDVTPNTCQTIPTSKNS